MSLKVSLKRLLIHHAPILRRPIIYPKIIKGFIDTLLLRKDVMRYLELQVNIACNSKCKMCFAAKMRDDDKKIMTVEEIGMLYKQLMPMGLVCGIVTGGEPTLRKDLIDIFEALESRKNIFAMTTNSLCLSRSYIHELKMVGVSQLNLSVNSFCAEDNDRERGVNGHYNHVMDVTEWAREIGMPVAYSVIVSHSNIPYIEEMLKYCEKKDVFFCPAWAVSMGNWANNREVRLTDDDWLHLHKLNRKYACMRMDISSNYSCRTDCPGAKEKIYVTAYGEVSTCQLNPVSFGSIREEPLPDIIKRMRSVPSFRRVNPKCVVSSDREYIEKYIDPILQFDRTPIRYSEHPVLMGNII